MLQILKEEPSQKPILHTPGQPLPLQIGIFYFRNCNFSLPALMMM